MLTEALYRKKTPDGRRIVSRNAVLWVGSVLAGLLAFALAQGLEHFTKEAGFYALQDLQNVAYDRGISNAAHAYQAAHPQPGPVVVVAIKQGTEKDLQNIPSFVPGVPGTL